MGKKQKGGNYYAEYCKDSAEYCDTCKIDDDCETSIHGDLECAFNDKHGKRVCTLKSPDMEPYGGAQSKKSYKGRAYVIRTGSRGGKYILVKGKKVYV